MPILSSQAIEQSISNHPGWQVENGEIVRNFEFRDFGEAMSFINSVASLAESAGHHPDIDIRYNKIRLALISHDEGGISAKDFNLAAQIDALL